MLAYGFNRTGRKFLELVHQPSTRQLTEQLSQLADDKDHNDDQSKDIKKGFDAFCFCSDSFEGNVRREAAAHANGMGLIDMDKLPVDADTYYKNLGGDEAMKLNGVQLAHRSVSGKGLHLVFRLQPGEDIAKGQQRLCHNLGIDPKDIDPAVKNKAGFSYVVVPEFFLYLNEEAFLAQTSAQSSDQASAQTPAQTSAIVPAESTAVVPAQTTALAPAMRNDPEIEDADIIEELPADSADDCYEGINIKLIATQILTRILKVMTAPSAQDHNRHSVSVRLAGYLAPVCDRDVEVLFRNMPKWGLPDQELREICQYACTNDAHKPLALCVRKLIEELKSEQAVRDGSLALSASTHSYIPPVPHKLPPLLQLLLKMVPEEYKAQALITSLSWLGTLATALRYSSDGGLHVESPTFLIYVVGHMGSGKGFTAVLNKLLEGPLKRNDDKAAQLIRAWKDAVEAAGNGRHPHRPHVPVRKAEADFTTPALISQIIDSQKQHVLIFSEESDEFPISRPTSTLLRKAFDNANCGQTRVSAQSVSGSAPTLLNVCLCGTPAALQQMIRNAENGLASRFIFVQMDPTLGRKKPVWHPLNDSDMRQLQLEVERLHKIGLIEGVSSVDQTLPATGEETELKASDVTFDTHEEVWIKSMPRLERRIEEWCEKRMLEYENTHAIAPDIFSHRIPTLMRRTAILMNALEGMKETSRGIDVALWVGEYAFQSFLNLFGRQYDIDYRNQLQATKEYQRIGHNVNLLDSLSNDFTFDDVVLCRRQLGLTDTKGTVRSCLSRWKQNGDITADDKVANLYHKTERSMAV